MSELEKIMKLTEKENVSFAEAREALYSCQGELIDALILLERKKNGTPAAANNMASDISTTAASSLNGPGDSDDTAPAADLASDISTTAASSLNGPGDSADSAPAADLASDISTTAASSLNGPGDSDDTAASADDIKAVSGMDTENSKADSTNTGYANGENEMKENTRNTESFRRKGTVRNFFKKAKKVLTGNYFTVTRDEKELIRIPVWIAAIFLLINWKLSAIALIVGLFFGCRYAFIGKDDLKEANDFMFKAGNVADQMKESFRHGFNSTN
ncbi:MAG: hypothetical protein IKN57_07005 [Parasporobacterium sp.]|nr:hypothetical protein [Parasporobacterium sp.]